MIIIDSITNWLKGKEIVEDKNDKLDKRILRLALRLDMKDVQQCGMVKALLTRLDVFWAELSPGQLKEVLGDLSVRQFFDQKKSESSSNKTVDKLGACDQGKLIPWTGPMVTKSTTPSAAQSTVPVVEVPLRRGIIRYQNGNYYHQAQDNDLCQCKHTKIRHINNASRPYCMEHHCPCSFFIKQYGTHQTVIVPAVEKITTLTEQKMPMLLENQQVTGVLDKSKLSD